MKVLVAIDSSHPSRIVVDEVARRTWPDKTEIRFLNVVDIELFGDSLTSAGGDLSSLAKLATRAAELLVNRAAEGLTGGSVTTSTAVVKGHPRIEIVKYAKEWKADYVIVGSHSRSGIARLVLGSVARTVLRRAPCSVEIVRARTKSDLRGMKILLATDGSQYSALAAKAIVERPWPKGTEVRIISVAEAVTLEVEPLYVEPTLMQSLIDSQIAEAQHAASSAKEVITAAHLAASTALPLGMPSGAVLDEAESWGADLIVLGSHGRHGLERLLIGSVSESVAMHAKCSVEVIRQKPAD